MPAAFIAAGSNINPADNMRKAVRLLLRAVRLTGISTIYRTEPEGAPGQSDYFNCVIGIETEAGPLELKYGILRRIEEALGRIRTEDKNAPRTMDLDLIIYDDLVLKTDKIELPDPRIAKRPFLAIPLLELAPDLRIPGTRTGIKDIAEDVVVNKMEPLPEYTSFIRKVIENGVGDTEPGKK